jgi:hypothetical protein
MRATPLRSVRIGRIGALALAAALGIGAAEHPAQDAVPPSPQQVLDTAFTRRYDVDFTANIELIMRSRSGQEQHRVFRAASKVIGGRVHSIGRLVWPEHVRGLAILTIEADQRSHDAFLYLPALAKVRRISMAQREDSFLGSDVTYEDLERRRANEYDVVGMEEGERAGEPVHLVHARPHRANTYTDVVFAIALSDAAMLEADYFRRGSDRPFRTIRAPRKDIVVREGHVFPTHFLVDNTTRGTSTEVWFRQIEIDPSIDDAIFSASALEQGKRIPGEDAVGVGRGGEE